MSDLDTILKERQVILTAGTGGVGKTTVSAALALRAAQLGRKAVVITVDPAKRLAQSLGMAHLGDDPTDLTPLLGDEIPRGGELWAVIPDTRRTFEGFVRSLAPSPQALEHVMGNPIFKIFAKEYSGTNEYMALKRLDALHSTRRFDIIVLDTPPSRNTLGFLDAPGLLSRFFDDRIIQWLVAPANKVMSVGMGGALKILEGLTGKGFLSHLVEFSTALFEVRLPFAENLRRVIALLRSESCGVVLVAAPAADTVPDLERFLGAAVERGLAFDGLVVNRTYSGISLTEADERRAAELAKAGRPELKEALEILSSLQGQEKMVLADLESCLNKADARRSSFFLRVPQLARDVHTLVDLAQVARILGGDGAAPAPGKPRGPRRAKAKG